jgi:hypothetical protein
MKATRGVVVGGACGVAALAILLAAWRSDDVSTELPAVGSSLSSPVDRGVRGAGGSADAGGPRPGAATGNSRPSAGTAGLDPQKRPADARPPRAGAAGAVAGGRRAAGGGPAGPGRPHARPDLPERRLDPALKDEDLPLDEAPDADAVAEALDDEAEEINEIAYDGGADRAFDTAAQVEVTEIGPIDGQAGAVAFWIEPGWQRNDGSDASFIQLGDGGLEILKDDNVLRVQYTDATGQVYGGTADIARWGAGDRRHVATTWNGGTMSLYIDGSQVFLNGGPEPPNVHGDPALYVGSALPGGAPAAPGSLSSLTVMNRELTPAEIRQMFESGGR